MSTYVSVCVENGEPLVPCPEPLCPSAGRLTEEEIRQLTDDDTFRRYRRLAFIRGETRVWQAVRAGTGLQWRVEHCIWPSQAG